LLLVERRILALLEREGVRPIPTVGQPFDPRHHLAVAAEPHPDLPDGTVVAETLRGFTHEERVLRPAEVVVARSQPDSKPWPERS
jgi:molecular chaperone GrpE